MEITMLQFILGVICIVLGLVFYVLQFIGLFRFHYVLNQIHAAAIGDTLGLALTLLGVLCFYGFHMPSLKIILIIVVMWLTSPVSTHMVMKLEVFSKKNMEECCPVKNIEEREA